MNFSRVVLWLSCAIFASLGGAFLVQPVDLARLVDIELPTPTARVDFMAIYGGLELGLAAFLAYCARRADRVCLGLIAVGCALVGLAATRLVGLLAFGTGKPILWLSVMLEFPGAVIAFWAARSAQSLPRHA